MSSLESLVETSCKLHAVGRLEAIRAHFVARMTPPQKATRRPGARLKASNRVSIIWRLISPAIREGAIQTHLLFTGSRTKA
jgi:hypothetical protein